MDWDSVDSIQSSEIKDSSLLEAFQYLMIHSNWHRNLEELNSVIYLKSWWGFSLGQTWDWIGKSLSLQKNSQHSELNTHVKHSVSTWLYRVLLILQEFAELKRTYEYLTHTPMTRRVKNSLQWREEDAFQGKKWHPVSGKGLGVSVS